MPPRVVVRTARRVYILDPNEIIWAEAARDYVRIHRGDKAHLVRCSMKTIEARLAGYGFRRIHRSSVVNVRHIRELVANDAGDYQVVLHGGTALRLSRNYRDALYAELTAASPALRL